MRISCEPKSEFFWKKLGFQYPEIYLDGTAVEHVVEADDEAGYVRVIDYDDGGRPRHAGGHYITKTLTGKVEIKDEPKAYHQ